MPHSYVFVGVLRDRVTGKFLAQVGHKKRHTRKVANAATWPNMEAVHRWQEKYPHLRRYLAEGTRVPAYHMSAVPARAPDPGPDQEGEDTGWARGGQYVPTGD